MLYVKRNTSGEIVAISREPRSDFESVSDAGSSEVEAFLTSIAGSEFQASDLGFIRALDDIIDLLISKNVILFTELPSVVQEKYTERAELRERRREALHLLEDGEIF
jgi:hypothetical protein